PSMLLAACGVLSLTSCAADPDADGVVVDAHEGVTANETRRPITLKTAVGGLFVVAEQGGGGAVNANRPVASTWETFALHDLNGGSLQSGDLVNLQSLDGHFVCAELGGGAGSTVNATRTQALGWETFRVVKIAGSPGAAVIDGDQIALQTTVQGTFVSAL